MVVTKRYIQQKHVRKLLSVYRMHKPNIFLPQESISTLLSLKNYQKYLVTDVQDSSANKVEALGVEKFMQGVFITHRFGLKSAKPSLYCFNKIRLENVAGTI